MEFWLIVLLIILGCIAALFTMVLILVFAAAITMAKARINGDLDDDY
jgi:hypothetical protein